MESGEFVRISVLLVVVALFIIFILLDASKAVNRKAHWVPSHFLVLSALIIQLLNLLSAKSALPDDATKGHLKDNELWMIHSSRVMLCVVMAYLLPSMAARESQEFWGKMAALGITILAQMTSEMYSVNSNVKSSWYSILSLWPRKEGSNELVFIGSTVLLCLSFVSLILLLGCAKLASRGIQGIFVQKIPLILSTTKDGERMKSEWQIIEDEVLKAWIVARAYTPEYIIARSALSSSAATVLTFLIWSSLIGWLLLKHFSSSEADPTVLTPAAGPTASAEIPGAFDKLKLMVTILQVIFILIGWTVIAWRWVIAAGYYTRWHSGTWRAVCSVEDYWTRHIKELIEDRQPKLLEAERLDKRVTNLISKPPTKNHIPRMLLYVLVGLQWTTVLCSKICWVVSLILFHNKCTSKLLTFILSKHDVNEFEKFSNYKKILKGLDMLGETPESLWIANRKSIAKARELITQGNHDGENTCEELVTLLQRRNKERPEDIDLSSFYTEDPPRFKYLWRAPVDEYKPLEVEKHFVEATKTSWKMTAVSLIRIIIQLSSICHFSECHGTSEDTSHDFPPKDVKDSLKAYSQAWEILDLVDGHEADGIMSEAADIFFLTLQKKVEKGDLWPKRICHSKPECVATAIDEIAKEGKENAEKPRGSNIMYGVIDKLGLKSQKEIPKLAIEDQESIGAYDSTNWKKVAEGAAVYKLCKSIGGSPNAMELFDELQCALADIIYGSITKAKSMLVTNSRQWARDSDENKIGRALYTAGKAKALVKMIKRSEKAEKENGGQEKRDASCMQMVPSFSENRETNSPDTRSLEIVTSKS